MILAIDIGGTKTLLGVFTYSGKLLESIRFETPNSYALFLAELEKNYQLLKHKSELRLCVAGAPGKIERRTGTVIAFGNLDWRNTPLGHDIQRITDLKVRVENDANLAGLSEAILIKHSYKKALYITISTGIGGVLIIDGVIDADSEDMEFGHMMFEHDDKLQKWQDFASGKAIYNLYGKKASEIEDPQIWYAISRNIALGLTNVVANHTPDVVIVGGGVGTHFDKYADQLHEHMMLYSSDLVSVPPIRKAMRAEEAVIYGCYELACQLKN
jgi:predicted NBD/HSP70 family sugar kinase